MICQSLEQIGKNQKPSIYDLATSDPDGRVESDRLHYREQLKLTYHTLK